LGLHGCLVDRAAGPRPVPARVVLRLALLERLGDLLFLAPGDPGTRVLCVDRRVAVPLAQGERDAPSRRRVLDRVGKQIVEHYSKLVLVSPDAYRGEVLVDRDLLRGGRDPVRRDDGGGELVERDRFDHLQIGHDLLRLRELQEVLDQLLQIHAVRADDRRDLGLFRQLLVQALREELRALPDGRERRLELVRYVSQERQLLVLELLDAAPQPVELAAERLDVAGAADLDRIVELARAEAAKLPANVAHRRRDQHDEPAGQLERRGKHGGGLRHQRALHVRRGIHRVVGLLLDQLAALGMHEPGAVSEPVPDLVEKLAVVVAPKRRGRLAGRIVQPLVQRLLLGAERVQLLASDRRQVELREVVDGIAEEPALREIALVVVLIVPDRERAERPLHLGQRLVEGAALLQRDGLDQRRAAVLGEAVDLDDRGDDGRDQRGLHDGEAEQDQPKDRTRTIQARPLASELDAIATYCTKAAHGAPRRKKADGEELPRR